MDASLGHGKSGLFGSGQYFRVDQRSFAAHLYPIEYLAPVQLEGAIYVSKFQVKDKVHQFFPCPGVHLTYQIVLTVQAVAGNDVVFVGQLQQGGQFFDVELAVPVGVEDPLLASCAETALQSSAIAPVDRVMDHLDLLVFLCQPVRYLGRRVGAAIVNDNNFVIVAYFFEYFQRLVRKRCYRTGFVMTWEKNR